MSEWQRTFRGSTSARRSELPVALVHRNRDSRCVENTSGHEPRHFLAAASLGVPLMPHAVLWPAVAREADAIVVVVAKFPFIRARLRVCDAVVELKVRVQCVVLAHPRVAEELVPVLTCGHRADALVDDRNVVRTARVALAFDDTSTTYEAFVESGRRDELRRSNLR